MVSVGVRWTGHCLPVQRKALLCFVQRLAEKNDEWLSMTPPRADEYSSMFGPEFMTTWREERLKSRPNVEHVDLTISEPIEIDSGVFWDYREFEHGANQLRLPVIMAQGADAEEGPLVVNFAARNLRRGVRLNGASIYGINFKIFGTNYPGEDRVSFVFLRCPSAPFLDGRIVEIFHRTTSPGLIRFETIYGADWYARAPEIHLRYYLEGWFDHFFSWVKFFFSPSFHWWRHESLPNYDRYRFEFEGLQANVGSSIAKSASFEHIMRALVAEAAPR
jgi:hypothetical protein